MASSGPSRKLQKHESRPTPAARKVNSATKVTELGHIGSYIALWPSFALLIRAGGNSVVPCRHPEEKVLGGLRPLGRQQADDLTPAHPYTTGRSMALDLGIWPYILYY